MTPAAPPSARRARAASLLVLVVAGLAACVHRRPPAPSPPAAGEQRGIASWYGRKFHGRPTASGERYDMHALTAAHPSLPFGTVVEVTNLTNGKSVRVRINDRGPFLKGRVIDLSYAAARVIDMIGPGTVPVLIRLVRDAGS